jgi:UrcA family protein
MIRYRSLTTIAIFAAVGAANPVLAGQNDSQRVHYGDLDLNSPAGIAAFDARLEQAVNQVCRSTSPYEIADQMNVRRCRIATRASVRGLRNTALAQARRNTIDLASR